MKIKVLEKTLGCFPAQFDKGEWYDLFTAEETILAGPHAKSLKKNRDGNVTEKTREVVFNSKMIPLGIAMEIPEGCEAHVIPRSSTFKKWGIIQSNSFGLIDGKQVY